MALIEDDALLYEVRRGTGDPDRQRLEPHAGQGEAGEPVADCALDRSRRRVPRPTSQWPASFLSVEPLAPEGCLPGFRRLVSNEGEESSWYSYREDGTRSLVCRQTQPGHRVVWETAVVPKDHKGDRVTFAFAGGLGYQTQPKTEGFVLEVNGKEALRFDLPEPRTWTSADKRIELRLDARRVIGPDYIGLFFLTIPRDLLKPGEPCRLGVHSLGSGSQRWFGLNPYLNAK